MPTFWIEPTKLPDRMGLILKKFNLSFAQLGSIGGVSPQAIKDIVDGVTKKPNVKTLTKICEELGISLDWLATGRGEIEDTNKITRIVERRNFGEEIAARIEAVVKLEYEKILDMYKEQLRAKDAQIDKLIERVGKLEVGQQATGGRIVEFRPEFEPAKIAV